MLEMVGAMFGPMGAPRLLEAGSHGSTVVTCAGQEYECPQADHRRYRRRGIAGSVFAPRPRASPAQPARVAPGDQMAGIDRSAVGRTWPSTDLFASGGRRGRARPGQAQPGFDSAALFARGDTPAGASRSLTVGVEVPSYWRSPSYETMTIYSSLRRGPPC